MVNAKSDFSLGFIPIQRTVVQHFATYLVHVLIRSAEIG
jgi:hypothetical protein